MNELDNFITWKGQYSPVFSYAFPDEKRLTQWKDELLQVKETCSNGGFKSPLIKLFAEKVDELLVKHQLLQAYSKQDFVGIEEGNRLLRGDFDEELVKLSQDKVKLYEDRSLLGAPLSFLQVKEKIEKKLTDLEIFGVEVVENSSNLSRISLTMGKEVHINLAQGIEFREKEIDAIVAHEIETHLVRYLNGLKSGWKIFASGTGWYLRDEEGLAVVNARKKLPEEYESVGI
ncbi:MAG: flavohemoglobin expression-modulating QEGLA motif protein, partial [Candidatus Peribacteria bacterium]|nr:flavohemoglobin expression-modulating QEGLA motif protein [Candidatus Peribacteria bacterium]